VHHFGHLPLRPLLKLSHRSHWELCTLKWKCPKGHRLTELAISIILSYPPPVTTTTYSIFLWLKQNTWVLQSVTMPTKNFFQLSLTSTHSSSFLYITHKMPIPSPCLMTSMSLNCNPHSFPSHVTGISLNCTILFFDPMSVLVIQHWDYGLHQPAKNMVGLSQNLGVRKCFIR
jgi:hypothetical protein